MTTTSIPVFLPLLNPNEPDALLASLAVQPGQQVSKGELICTLETTKSTAEVTAEAPGYIAGLRFQAGQTVKAGEVLCYLAASPDWAPPESPVPAGSGGPGEGMPLGLRISQPALEMARQAGIDLEKLPQGPFITESSLRPLIEKARGSNLEPVEAGFDPTAIIIFGGGGHGKSLIDLLRLLGTYRLAGVVDDNLPPGEKALGVPVIGGSEALPALYAQGIRLAVNAVGGIGNIATRITVFQRLAEAGFACPAVVHPAAFVEPSARLSPGVQVFAHAYLGSDAHLGFGTIVNTGAIVSHDCRLGDYVNLSPGAILAGAVEVGSGALIGMGVTVNLEAKIGAGARIGNGATIKADVPEGGIVRAGTVWPG